MDYDIDFEPIKIYVIATTRLVATFPYFETKLALKISSMTTSCLLGNILHVHTL